MVLNTSAATDAAFSTRSMSSDSVAVSLRPGMTGWPRDASRQGGPNPHCTWPPITPHNGTKNGHGLLTEGHPGPVTQVVPIAAHETTGRPAAPYYGDSAT